MPSNKDLTDAILKLDPKAAVDGLNNPKLEALLSALKAPAPAASNDPVVSPSSEPAPVPDFAAEAAKSAEDVEAKRNAKLEAEAAEQVKKQIEANAAQEAARKGDATHKVAEGKAITCLRGMVADGDAEDLGGGRVSARDFSQKDVDIERLVAVGVLVKL
jgi:hypothetical protein